MKWRPRLPSKKTFDTTLVKSNRYFLTLYLSVSRGGSFSISVRDERRTANSVWNKGQSSSAVDPFPNPAMLINPQSSWQTRREGLLAHFARLGKMQHIQDVLSSNCHCPNCGSLFVYQGVEIFVLQKLNTFYRQILLLPLHFTRIETRRGLTNTHRIIQIHWICLFYIAEIFPPLFSLFLWLYNILFILYSYCCGWRQMAAHCELGFVLGLCLLRGRFPSPLWWSTRSDPI